MGRVLCVLALNVLAVACSGGNTLQPQGGLLFDGGFGGSSSGTATSSSSSSSSSSSGGGSSSSSGSQATWQALETPGHANLHAVASGLGGVFAVGDEGVILRFADGFWSAQESPTTQPLWGVWADPTSVNAVAVGSGATLLWYNGATWSQTTLALSPQIPLNAVWGTSSTQIYVVGGRVGEYGVVFSYNGASWQSEVAQGQLHAMFAVGESLSGLPWAVGEAGVVYSRYGNGSWTAVYTQRPASTFLALTKVGQLALVVGLNGEATTYDGFRWDDTTVPRNTTVLGITTLRDNTALAVGEHGGLFRRGQYGAWEDTSLPTVATLWGVTQVGDTVMVVGDQGTSFIYR